VQVNRVQLAKEYIERSCSDNINAAERRAELREAELNKLIVNLQTKHGTYDKQFHCLIITHCTEHECFGYDGE